MRSEMLNRLGRGPDVAVRLIEPADRDVPLAWRGGRAVSRGAFLADVYRLADALPERRQVVNYCADRYRFLTALAAAVLRGQVTHLPHDKTQHSLSQLMESHEDLYCLTDADPPAAGIAVVEVDATGDSEADANDAPAIARDRIAAHVYTAGTTGRPKANPKTWGALADGAWRIGAGIGLDDAPRPVMVATVPAQHMYGLELSVMLPLRERVSLHPGRPFYPADVEKAVREQPAPAILVTTPIHLNALVASGHSLPGVVKIVSATADLAVDLAERAEARFQAPVMEIYGCSEAGSLASRHTVASPHWRTLEGLSLQARDGHWYAHVPYLPEPVLLHDVIDLLSPQEFALRGRESEMIVVAGKRASLAGLNAILTGIPGVVDGAYFAAAAPDKRRVSRLVAFVVAPDLSEAEIGERLRQRIDPAFLPRPLYRVDALPRSDTGKLSLAALAALARRMHNAA